MPTAPERPPGATHRLIEGDNAVALANLRAELVGQVDVVYLDPPWMTGRLELTHDDPPGIAAWRDGLTARLHQVRPILAPAGVVIAHVGEAAHHHMRAVLDEVVGARHHLATVIIESPITKSRSRFVAQSHSYLTIHARNAETYAAAVPTWRNVRTGSDELLAVARRVWDEAGGDRAAASQAMVAWHRALPERSPLRTYSRYRHFHPDSRLARDDNPGAPHPGGHVYDLLHPVTGRPAPMPANGWRFPLDEMQRLDAAGELRWGLDHRRHVAILRAFAPDAGAVPRSVEQVNPTAAARLLERRLGRRPQGTFPKDVAHLARWLRLVTGGKPDALILDPYAGTGTTAEAVMLLNAADGGHRQSILIERDEPTFRDILVPRLRAAIRNDYPGETLTIEAAGDGLDAPTRELADDDPEVLEAMAGLAELRAAEAAIPDLDDARQRRRPPVR